MEFLSASMIEGAGWGNGVSGEGGGGSEPFGWLEMRERYLFLKRVAETQDGEPKFAVATQFQFV